MKAQAPQQLQVKDTVFNRPLSPGTLRDRSYSRVSWDGSEATDLDLILGYRYSMLVNALIRCWTFRGYCWTTNDSIFLNQYGSPDRLAKLREELTKRNLYEIADNGYSIDFDAIRKAIDSNPKFKK